MHQYNSLKFPNNRFKLNLPPVIENVSCYKNFYISKPLKGE